MKPKKWDVFNLLIDRWGELQDVFDLIRRDREIFFALLRFADARTLTCFPSVDRIATAVDLGRRQTQKRLGMLSEKGLLGIERRRRSRDRNETNDYDLHLLLFATTKLNEARNPDHPPTDDGSE
jgi:predicted transcriptional regulator